ncbi:MAG TPA: hypothetical protein VIK18_20855 [Pirellulales bacterium]
MGVLLIAVVAGLAPAPAAAQLPAINLHLAQQLRHVRPWMVGGRISVAGIDPTRSTNVTARGIQQQERLQVNFSNGLVSLNYEMVTPAFQLTITVTDSNEVIVRRVPKSPASETGLEFVQPADGQLALRVTHGERQQHLRAPSYWHLALAWPKVCETELAPILEVLRPDWGLAKTATELEAALQRDARHFRPLDRNRLQQLLRELGSREFARREAAQRQLQEAGETILPFLRAIDRGHLDAEQAFRVRSVIHGMHSELEEDAPSSLAPWLAGDPYIWLTLLDREQEPLRRFAAEQLGRLLDKTIRFDPAADAAVRQRQLKAITAEVNAAWGL